MAYHWSNQSLPWDKLNDYWDPVNLYRKVLAEQDDGSVTITSIGFFENVTIPYTSKHTAKVGRQTTNIPSKSSPAF